MTLTSSPRGSLLRAKDRFFERRRASLNIKARDLVLQRLKDGVHVQIAIIYAYSNEVTVFNTHPHLPYWPPPIEQLVSSFLITVDHMFIRI